MQSAIDTHVIYLSLSIRTATLNMSEIFSFAPLLRTSSSHFSWPVLHGKRHLNTAGRLHVYLFEDIYAGKGALKVFAYVPPVPCLSTLSERVEGSQLQRRWGAIRRWWSTFSMTVWSPPDATNVAFSSFQAFDVQLFIIRQFSIFTLCLKSTWSQNWRNCTFTFLVLLWTIDQCAFY